MALLGIILYSLLSLYIFHLTDARSILSTTSTRTESLDGITAPKAIAPFGISYFGGRLLTQPISVNFIVYGDKWPKNVHDYTSAFSDFVKSSSFVAATSKVGDVKQWWNIMTSYTDGKKAPVSTSVSVGAIITDLKSQGTLLLTDFSLRAIVTGAFVKGLIKPSNFAINVVVTDSSVTLTNGFCKVGCGSHGSFAYNKFDILYVHVGNAEVQCPSLCMPQFTFPQKGIYWQPPNKIAALDAMINVLAHELMTTANDPNPNRLPVVKPGYFDGTSGPYKGYESADFCAYDYGIVQVGPITTIPRLQAPAFNVLGANKRQFLIQSNYHFLRKMCVMS